MRVDKRYVIVHGDKGGGGSKVQFGVFFFLEKVSGRTWWRPFVSCVFRTSSFTARVRIILPVYRVELMLHLGILGPV